MNEKKTVVITGANRGLGLELAKTFADSQDWNVVGTGRSACTWEFPDIAEYYQFDASIAEECSRFWQAMRDARPLKDIVLINNAGGYVQGGWNDIALVDYANQMNMNYFPAVYMTRTLMDAANQARIINVISMAAHGPQKKNAAYGASKAAVKYFFQTVQKERTSGVKVTNIYPDSIATHGSDDKAMRPRDLALLVKDLAKSDSSYYIRDLTLATDIDFN